MTKPILDRAWLWEYDGEKALRIDFSNDRHHMVMIARPFGPQQLEEALIQLARNIRLDPSLQGTK